MTLTYTKVRKLAEQLPLEEQAKLVQDLVSALADAAAAQRWDKQIEEDVQAGKLDDIAETVLTDFEAGRCSTL